MNILLNDILRKVWLLAMLSVMVFAGANHVAHASCVQADSLHLLEAVEVNYHAPLQGVTIGPDGAVRVSASAVTQGIHVLGEADAMRTLSMLPGFSGGSDYSGGLSIDGSDPTQNVFLIDGARVLHPFHFGGIFSDFNTRHISSVRVGGKSLAGAPACVGSVVEVSTPQWAQEDASCGVDLGLISAGASVSAPIGKRMGLWVAARMSYLDALYGDVLSADNNSLSYGFNDANLTWVAQLSASDLIKVNAFTSSDKLHFDDDDYLLSMRLKWRNLATDVEFSHAGDNEVFTQQVSLSGLWSHLDMDMVQLGLKMPSSTVLATANGHFEDRCRSYELGYRFEHAHFLPQQATTEGVIASTGIGRDYDSWSFIVDASRTFDLRGNMQLEVAVRPSVYKAGVYRCLFFDPEISLSKVGVDYVWRATAKTATQYMHQVGISDIGMASNFWIPALKDVPAQRSYGAEVFGTRTFADAYQLSGKAFAYRVTGCPEYDSSVLALIASDYDPMAFVHTADGYNLGGNFSLSYTGHVISWRAGYSLAVCRRRFSDVESVGAVQPYPTQTRSDDNLDSEHKNEWVSASTEPLSSFKASVDWCLNPRISLSAYAVVASGRPYTPVRAIYVVGGNILTEYGKRNSARLPMYQRVDLSVSYRLPSVKAGGRKIESFVNLSVINALAHRNVELQFFSYNDKSEVISLRQVSSLYRMLPSLSYSVRF